MTGYPAVDLRDCRCVRLEQGDPVRTGREWVEQGAEWPHVVDLEHND